jgi:hypothetical protein
MLYSSPDSSSSSNFQTNFARSRQLRYRWYELLLCAARLLMVYNVTPWYHGWSHSSTVDHSTSMHGVHGDLPTSFYDRPGSIFVEMFLIRRRDDRGSEDRSCTIDNSCFEVVERCKYVTGGMEIDLTPLPSPGPQHYRRLLFAYNTPIPFL